MEPDRQIEIQLGHMCNNRCVFCVSGQRTELREAFPTPGDPVIQRLREARASGIEKVTLLGGEPTIQPDFLRIVRAAAELSFREIVIFTNGVKTSRASFIDEVLATGGQFTWRLSFQGATRRAHDQTTKKFGSFQRLVETLGHLRDRKQRITVNMCVVRSNYDSIEEFAALLLPFGVTQLHLDMIRPLDAGVRTDEELRAMMPRHSDVAPHLERMVARFPKGFDVNIGNLPFCVAPSLARAVHHDGNETLTIAVDHRDSLSEPWNKYENKKRDKVKPSTCSSCVFDRECSGVYHTYRRFHGVDELAPITPERLVTLDPQRRLFTRHAAGLVAALRALGPDEVVIDTHGEQIVASFGASRLALRSPFGGLLSSDQFSIHWLDGPLDEALVRRVFSALAPGIDPRIARCVARLGDRAPYGGLTLRGARFDATSARIEFTHRDDVGVTIELSSTATQLRSTYRLDRAIEAPSSALVDDVRAAMLAVRG